MKAKFLRLNHWPLCLLLLACLTGLLTGLHSPGALAQETSTFYVDAASTNPVRPYTNWATAARTIQEAISASTAPGRLVLVTNGVYRNGEMYSVGWNRIALTNAVVVRSVNGPGLTAIEGAPAPAPDRDNAFRCAYVGASAVLDGFTLTKGNRLTRYNNLGGGAYCEPWGMLTNCVLTGNSAGASGGGAYQGTLLNCTLTGNSATNGGGAYAATLTNCVLTTNSATAAGGGTYQGTLYNCSLTGNSATNGGGAYGAMLINCVLTTNSATAAGGGAYQGTLNNCSLTGNSAKDGGGAYAATLTNCVLTANSATASGGGAYEGALNNCTLSGNTASGGGGGAWRSTLQGCTLTGNSANGGGGALEGTLSQCTLTGNRALSQGGGAIGSTLTNCTLSGNSAQYGGGVSGATLSNCVLTGNSANDAGGGALGGTLYNCTLTGNSAFSGGGVSDGTLYNCLVYFNQAPMGANWWSAHFEYPCIFEYSCTTPLPPGPGNLDPDPQLASAFHLAPTSPCLGKGKPASASGVDIDGEPWADPPAIGADQVWPAQNIGSLNLRVDAEFTQFAIGFPVWFSGDSTGHITRSVWDFGDGTVATNQPCLHHTWSLPGSYTVRLTGYNDSHPEGVTTTLDVQVIEATHYVNAANPSPVFPYMNWATAATNIQDAVNAGTVTGRLVLVTNGVYNLGSTVAVGTNRVALTNVTLQSVSGPETTIIDGAGEARCVYLGGSAVLNGFTLRSGKAGSGGGVHAAANGVVTNCILTGNTADGGGAAYRATLLSCTLRDNSAGAGGGAYEGTLDNCTLAGNSAGWGGGGAAGGTLYDCMVTGNSAVYEGGGALSSTLYNCTLAGNSARYGGGTGGSTLHNCTLRDNTARDNGGGAFQGALHNCTVTGNSAEGRGGGAAGGTLYNCIVYFNCANQGANWTWASGLMTLAPVNLPDPRLIL